MSKIQVQVEVTKEAYELGKGIAAIVDAVMVATKDGFQVGQDLPAIAIAAFGQMTAIEGIDKLKEEMEANPAEFYKALGLALADIYGVVQKHKAEEVVAG